MSTQMSAGHCLLFLVLEKVAGAKGGGRVHRLGAFVDVLDNSILVDHQSNSVGKQAGEVENPVSLGGGLLGVTEEGEGGADLCREGPVGLRLVDTYPEHLRIRRREPGDISLIRLEFLRSTRRACPYVEGQDDGLLPPEAAELHDPALLVRQREIRRSVTNPQVGLRDKRQQHESPQREARGKAHDDELTRGKFCSSSF